MISFQGSSFFYIEKHWFCTAATVDINWLFSTAQLRIESWWNFPILLPIIFSICRWDLWTRLFNSLNPHILNKLLRILQWFMVLETRIRTQCNSIADFTYYQCWDQNLALKSISQTIECPKCLQNLCVFRRLYLVTVHPIAQQKCQFG